MTPLGLADPETPIQAIFMYRCQVCKGQVPAGNARKLIVRKRPKQYPFRKAVNRPLPFIDPIGRKKVRVPDDPGGVGWEIDGEIWACEKCLAKHIARQNGEVAPAQVTTIRVAPEKVVHVRIGGDRKTFKA